MKFFFKLPNFKHFFLQKIWTGTHIANETKIIEKLKKILKIITNHEKILETKHQNKKKTNMAHTHTHGLL